VKPLSKLAERPHSSTSSLPRLSPLPAARNRILDFDVETIAAGFADPQWVPQKITCVAWSWVGEDKVHSRICGTDGIYHAPHKRRRMLEALVEAINEADVLTGHNILRFDLPVINSECLRLGMQPLGIQRVHDTMNIVKTKGFKKGQDVLIELNDIPLRKMALSWQGWEQAYSETGWKTVRERCESDVLGHKMLYQRMTELGWLKGERKWRP
jgi:DNA polymerase elongation subunit (family B)